MKNNLTSSSLHCVLGVMGSWGRMEEEAEEPRLEEAAGGGQGESSSLCPSLASLYTIT
jgi:hypothetical protein